MGLRMTDFDPPVPGPTHADRLASWGWCQSQQTNDNISSNDVAYFSENGAFPPRAIFTFSPIILRVEPRTASNSYLLPGTRRAHFDIHPTSAQTLPELIAVLVEQIPNLSLPHTSLNMENRTNITSNPSVHMELQVQNESNTTTSDNEETYANWWKAQFVYGRVAVVIVKVSDMSR